MMNRFALAAGLAAALCMGALPAAAKDFPAKEIKIIGTSAAGSPLDTMLRNLAQGLGGVYGVSVVVENRPGGSGAVGMSVAMSQPADGYTLVSGTGSTSFSVAKGQIPFTFDDFKVLRAVQAEPSSVAVRGDSKYKTLADLVADLKANPDTVQVGGFASAGFHQFVYFQLATAAGFKPTWIPFDGGNEAALALLGGHINAAVMTPSSASAQVASGEIRLLGISTEERSEFFPEVPTMKEQGYDVVEAIWRGVMIKAGAKQEVIDRLLDGIAKVEATDAWKAYMKDQAQEPMKLGMAEINAKVAREVETRRAFLTANGFIK